MLPPLPPSWQAIVSGERTKPYFVELERFLAEERKSQTIYPPEHLTFRAEPAALVVEVPTRRGFDNGTYRLYSQVLLAREAGR